MIPRIVVRRALPEDAPALAAMMLALWPDAGAGEMRSLAADLTAPAANAPTFIAMDGNVPVGFLYASLRPYAEGCEGSPVPFVEGWWVAETHRRQGIGRALMNAIEAWARDNGFNELGSDTEQWRVDSQRTHQALGFELQEPIVPMMKRLR